MRILSIFLPTLATDRIRRRWRGDEPQGLATVAKIKNAQRLVAVDAHAMASGLKPGMMLADARAMLPALACVSADLAAEAQTLTDITDWCRRFTPLAALDPPDGVMLDVTGATHLFGGEEALLADIESRLAAQGFAACCALAPTAEAAWALARFGQERLGKERRRPMLLREDNEKEIARLLGRLPLAALRLEDETIAALAQAGLRRIEDLLLRPRAPLAARFGSHLFARLDGVLGRAKHPITPRFEAPPYLVERRFADAILREDDVEASLLALAHELVQLLTQHGEGARSLDCALFRIDGAVNHIEVGFSRPSRDAPMMARLFREKIAALAAESEDDPLDAGFGFDVLRLSALAVERLDQKQTQWLTGDEGESDLADLIDRLGARLGVRRVMRFAFADTHSPEFAVTSVSFSPSSTGRRWREAPDEGRGGLVAAVQNHPAPHLTSPRKRGEERQMSLPTRPLRLLSPPEPIETIAGVPDGPPLRFRWRRVLHEIAAIEGPERIAPEWWKNEASFTMERDAGGKPVPTFPRPALTRDYFRAEDLQGQRFWLFREGLYERETAVPRWFMHGLFA